MGEYFFSLAIKKKKLENQHYSTQCSAHTKSLRSQNEVSQGDQKDLLHPGTVAHT